MISQAQLATLEADGWSIIGGIRDGDVERLLLKRGTEERCVTAEAPQ
jgi:hypothetical protein